MSEKDPTFDSRTVELLLRRGEITRDQHKAWLDGLPDERDEGEETKTRFTATYAQRHYDEPNDAGDSPEPASKLPIA